MSSHLVLFLGFAMAFLVSGAAIWLPGYSGLSLPNALFGFPLWVIFICAFFGRFSSNHGGILVSFVIGAAPLLAYFLRMVADTAKDPTSHNLWPIALFLAGAVSFPVAAMGSSLAWFLEAIQKKHRARKNDIPNP